jgi:hypothetical protein
MKEARPTITINNSNVNAMSLHMNGFLDVSMLVTVLHNHECKNHKIRPHMAKYVQQTHELEQAVYHISRDLTGVFPRQELQPMHLCLQGYVIHDAFCS